MGCATSRRLKWGPFPPNEVGRIAQYARKRVGRIEGKDVVGIVFTCILIECARNYELISFLLWHIWIYCLFCSLGCLEVSSTLIASNTDAIVIIQDI